MTNDVVITSEFEKLYKKKREKSPKYIADRVDRGLIELRNSEEPERLGMQKKGKLSDYYAYNLSRGHRILYQVERNTEGITIYLHRVCDHKNVYQKD
ncbi:MAG: hypothetical protein FWC44_01130 [Methanomassiliicoccaceae archaeon]|nr:hypothetical protein [Methanomassiliicoccaceae archaeon]